MLTLPYTVLLFSLFFLFLSLSPLHSSRSVSIPPESQKAIKSDPTLSIGLHGEGYQLLVPHELRTQTEKILWEPKKKNK